MCVYELTFSAQLVNDTPSRILKSDDEGNHQVIVTALTLTIGASTSPAISLYLHVRRSKVLESRGVSLASFSSPQCPGSKFIATP